MTAKKPVIEKKEIKKKFLVKLSPKESEFIKPEIIEKEFPEIKMLVDTKYDFNYVGIRRLIQRFNFFQYVKNKYADTNELLYEKKESLWDKYVYYFNKYINRSDE